MSHYYLKTEYSEVQYPYGSVSRRTLYAHHNNSTDDVSIYDGDGNLIFTYQDTEKDNLLEAIERLTSPWQRSQVLEEGVDYMSPKELLLCDLI